jgi:hypothetical protein
LFLRLPARDTNLNAGESFAKKSQIFSHPS